MSCTTFLAISATLVALALSAWWQAAAGDVRQLGFNGG